LAVSRKYGNAVQRNYFKRIFREAMRTSPMRNLGVDVLVIPQTSAINMMDISAEARQAFEMLEKRLQEGRACAT